MDETDGLLLVEERTRLTSRVPSSFQRSTLSTNMEWSMSLRGMC